MVSPTLPKRLIQPEGVSVAILRLESAVRRFVVFEICGCFRNREYIIYEHY